MTRLRTALANRLIIWGIALMPDSAWVRVEDVHDHLLGDPL